MSLGNQVIAFNKKYGGRILYYLVFFFVIFYLDKHQEKFYLKSDVENAKPLFQLTFGLIWILLFVIIIIKSFRTAMSPKTRFFGVFTNAIIFAIAYFLFTELFRDTALFVNRKIPVSTIQRTYLVGYFNGGDSDKHQLTLKDFETKASIYQGRLIDSLNVSGLASGDTLQINFAKGLFGVALQWVRNY